MKYLDYKEEKMQGTTEFPVAYYHVDLSHPRYQMPYHWHLEYEIIRILKGFFHMTVDGCKISAEKGDILFINGGTLHGGVPEDCIYECVVFNIKLLIGYNILCNNMIKKLQQHEIIINLKLPSNNTQIAKSTDDLFIIMDNKTPGFEFMAQGALFSLFGSIFEAGAYQLNPSHNLASQKQIKRFKDVLNYIEEHYMEQISLGDMAKIAGLDTRYFCRYFRKMTQYTPTRYLNFYRIECACKQLADNHASITDVAFNCGFNDISYFIKTFHKAKGMTPKQYRDTNRQFTKLR